MVTFWKEITGTFEKFKSASLIPGAFWVGAKCADFNRHVNPFPDL